MEEQTAKVKETSSATAKINYAQFLLPGAILLAAIIISGTLIFTRGQNGAKGTAQIGGAPQEQGKPVDIKINSDDHILGSKDAKVTIVEYSDFQCPFCGRFWKETLPQIEKDFIDTGKVRFVYRHFPLPSHEGAKPAAYATECANEQGKFWEMHDKIYGEQAKGEQLTKANIKNWASAIGLDVAKFNKCFDSDKYAKKVSGDLSSGQSAGVTGTPAFFINGQKIVGAQPYESFKQAIDALLK